MTTVLLVDSDVGVLSTLGLLMAAEGYVVRTETEGLRALALARHTPPDVLIWGCAAPDPNGADLLRALLNDLALMKLPVIVTSAARLHAHRKSWRFLRKPVSPSRLVRLVHQLSHHSQNGP